MNKNRFYVDGGTSDNGGPNQSSVICVTDKMGNPVIDKAIGNKTNNEAELIAILEAVMAFETPHLYSDSLLAVRLVQRKYMTKIPRLTKIIEEINQTGKLFTIDWVPRERNLAGIFIERKYGL